jgi:hypothetical protein
MLFTVHQGQNNPALPSPRIWERATGASVATEGNNGGTWAGDDFTLFSGYDPATSDATTLPTTKYTGPNGYGVYVDTGTGAGDILPLSSDAFDYTSIQLTTHTTDEHQTSICAPGLTGILGSIGDTGGAGGTNTIGLQAFECRVRFPTNVTADDSTFIGLATPTLCVDSGMIDATGELADADGVLGFQVLGADPNALNFVYSAGGDAGAVEVGTTGLVIVTDTWYKFGYVFDPNAVTSKRITWYADNDEQPQYVTNAVIEGATFPTDEPMQFFAGCKNHGGTAAKLDIDWWYFFQQSIGGAASDL